MLNCCNCHIHSLYLQNTMSSPVFKFDNYYINKEKFDFYSAVNAHFNHNYNFILDSFNEDMIFLGDASREPVIIHPANPKITGCRLFRPREVNFIDRYVDSGVSEFLINQKKEVIFFRKITHDQIDIIKLWIKNFLNFFTAENIEEKIKIAHSHISQYPFLRHNLSCFFEEYKIFVILFHCFHKFKCGILFSNDKREVNWLILTNMLAAFNEFEMFMVHYRFCLWKYVMPCDIAQDNFTMVKNVSTLFSEFKRVYESVNGKVFDFDSSRIGLMDKCRRECSSPSFSGDIDNLVGRSFLEDLQAFHSKSVSSNEIESIDDDSGFFVCDWRVVQKMVSMRKVLIYEGVVICPLQMIFPKIVHPTKSSGIQIITYQHRCLNDLIVSRFNTFSKDLKVSKNVIDGFYMIYDESLLSRIESLGRSIQMYLKEYLKNNIALMNPFYNEELKPHMQFSDLKLQDYIEPLYHKRFPPCINAMFLKMKNENDLSYASRKFLQSYFINIGISMEDYVEIINRHYNKKSDSVYKIKDRLNKAKTEFSAALNNSKTAMKVHSCGFMISNQLCPFLPDIFNNSLKNINAMDKSLNTKKWLQIVYELDQETIDLMPHASKKHQVNNPCGHLCSIMKNGPIVKEAVNPLGFFIETPTASKIRYEQQKHEYINRTNQTEVNSGSVLHPSQYKEAQVIPDALVCNGLTGSSFLKW